MTPQEQNMLGDLIRRIQSTNLTEKDPDAQRLLDQQLANHPDALYVLAQTVLVQNYALEQAKRQVDELKQQAQSAQPAKASSFLGSLFGHQDAPKPAPASPSAPAASYAQNPPATQWSTPQQGQSYAPSQAYPSQGVGGPAYGGAAYGGQPQGYVPAPGGGSSFLRSAATTAAGVAAGALAFEGVESLMHGFGHAAGFGGGGFGGSEFGGFGGGGFGERPVEETVVNNYYDDRGDREGGERDRYDTADDRGDDASSRDMPPLHDASFTGPQSDDDFQPQLDQADDVNVTDDSGSFDDASYDGGDSGGGDDSSFV